MEYFESSLSKLKPTHVYISFRGDEEGIGKFIRSLSAALKAQGFRILGDDKRHETPNSDLPDHLCEAFAESWVRILVFSKNYASSCWCLQEFAQLAKVYTLTVPHRAQGVFEGGNKVSRWRQALKQGSRRLPGRRSRVRAGRTVAVFYDDVDLNSLVQRAGETYAQHLLVLPWLREAIKEEASLSAWHVRNHSSRSQVIQKIVREVKAKTDKLFYDFYSFVGIQSQVEEVEKLLDLSTDDDEVRVIGICGMSGLGKSSIATVLYLKIFHYFDAFCFLPNVSERLKQGDLSLQQLLHRNLETENSEIKHIILGQEFSACKLRNYKFLIVLDGVDFVQDIEELKLIEKSDCFGGGSRIIITTRDEQVLEEYEVDAIYRPQLLSKDESFELFCSEAFPSGYPIEDDIKEMINRVLEYANGLPLALEIMGSSFFDKGVAEWRSFLDREEIIPPYELIIVLRKSFDELEGTSQEMFLDIACFFVGKDINHVKEILHDSISSCVDITIKLLIQKSIITISNQMIQMHGMLQAMGREIIRRKSPKQPEFRCRLYLFNDIRQVMEKESNMEIELVKAIALDLEEPKRVTMRIEGLSRMINLRLLIFRNVKFYGTLNNLSSKLRYVSWHQYPFTGLPSGFQSDTLAQLVLPESSITEVWKGKMMLPKLRRMDLCGSEALIRTPDFGGVLNLDRLELEGCTGLLQLDPSIANLSHLRFLNLRGCISLASIPNSLFSQNSLEVLNLAGCSKFAHCLKFSPMKSLILVKLLSIWQSPFLEKLLYFLLFVLPEQKTYHEFACCCLIYLMCICEVKYASSSSHD